MKTQKVILTTITVFTLCFNSCSQNDNSTLSKAKQEYIAGNLASSKILMVSYSKHNSLSANAWSFLGTIYLESAILDSALIAYDKSLQLDSNNYKSLTGKGVILRYQGKLEEAKKQYFKALLSKPNDPNALSSLAIIHLKQGDFQEAVNKGELAIKTKPVRLGIKGNLMISYHFNNQPNKRDKLIKELKEGGYKNLDNLLLLINGEIGLDAL